MVVFVKASVHVYQVRARFFGRDVNVNQTAMALVGLKVNNFPTGERFKWFAGLVDRSFLCIAFQLELFPDNGRGTDLWLQQLLGHGKGSTGLTRHQETPVLGHE